MMTQKKLETVLKLNRSIEIEIQENCPRIELPQI